MTFIKPAFIIAIWHSSLKQVHIAMYPEGFGWAAWQMACRSASLGNAVTVRAAKFPSEPIQFSQIAQIRD